MAEQKAVCGGFLVGDGLEMNGKVLSATGGGGKFYTLVNIDPITIKDAGKDIETIMANGGFTIRYFFEEGQCDMYDRFIFVSTSFFQDEGKVAYGFKYGEELDLYIFEIIGDDLIAFISP